MRMSCALSIVFVTTAILFFDRPALAQITSPWTQVASTNSMHGIAGATPGPDGRIYVLGGEGSNSNPSTTVEAYDPSSNTWTNVAPMNVAREDLAAVTLNGNLYALGGDANGTVEAYDPTSNTWTPPTGPGSIAPMHIARTAFAAVALNGRIYAIGGSGPSGFLSSVEMYDPTSNSWTPLTGSSAIASMNVSRVEFGAVAALDGRIYAMGGVSDGDTNSVEAYNPSTNTWTPPGAIAAMNTTHSYFPAVLGPDGNIYAIAGLTGDTNQNTTVEEYLSNSNSWKIVSPLLAGKFGHCAAVADGKIYAIGSLADSTVEAYDPVMDRSFVAPMPGDPSLPDGTGRVEIAATANPIDG